MHRLSLLAITVCSVCVCSDNNQFNYGISHTDRKELKQCITAGMSGYTGVDSTDVSTYAHQYPNTALPNCSDLLNTHSTRHITGAIYHPTIEKLKQAKEQHKKHIQSFEKRIRQYQQEKEELKEQASHETVQTYDNFIQQLQQDKQRLMQQDIEHDNASSDDHSESNDNDQSVTSQHSSNTNAAPAHSTDESDEEQK